MLALLLSFSAHAADLDATLGVGIGKNVLHRLQFERGGQIGLQYGSNWKVKANGGYWLALGEGECSAYWGSLQVGPEVVGQGGTFATLMFGPGLVSQDDVKISGHFQFHLSGGIGVKNESGHSISFQWVHFSNAGIRQPNHGRDLISVQIAVPLYRE